MEIADLWMPLNLVMCVGTYLAGRAARLWTDDMKASHALPSVSCPWDGVSEHPLYLLFIGGFINSKMFGLMVAGYLYKVSEWKSFRTGLNSLVWPNTFELHIFFEIYETTYEWQMLTNAISGQGQETKGKVWLMHLKWKAEKEARLTTDSPSYAFPVGGGCGVICCSSLFCCPFGRYHSFPSPLLKRPFLEGGSISTV